MEVDSFQEKARIEHKLLHIILGFVIRKSMQPSHLQCSSENPQNPDGEQQGLALLGSHSPSGPKFHAGPKDPHLNSFS